MSVPIMPLCPLGRKPGLRLRRAVRCGEWRYEQRGRSPSPSSPDPRGTVRRVAIRAARLSDAEGIRQIYNEEVLNGTSTFDIEPRSLAVQQSWLQDRSGVHAVLVATPDRDDDTVVGFASLSPFHSRPAYNTTVENSVYVHVDHRGKGVGRALLVELIALAQSHGFHTVIARVSGKNEASVAAHRSAGFEVIGVEREVGRKFGRWLDVTVMQLMLRDWSGR